MSYLEPSTSFLQTKERIGQGAMSGGSQPQSPYTTSIHIIDDYSLLNIFYLYRPFLLCEEGFVDIRFWGGVQWQGPEGECWWYRLAHVCQRWRNLILGSASYLGLCLVCTYGTPVADMLAHSPLLPLVLDYCDEDITTEDEEAIVLALEQRDRVRRIRFTIPVLKLQKLIMAIDGEYPILEYLILGDQFEEKDTVLVLPETLQTPHLRHLAIKGSIPIPVRAPLLGTAAGLAALYLALFHPSTYFQPTVLLQWLSSTPQLEMLMIFFYFPVPNRDVERQLMRRPITTHVTLPNLRSFALQSVSAYSEAVLSRITAPHLEDFRINYFKQLTFSVPQLKQFVGRTENLRFNRVGFYFFNVGVYVHIEPPQDETNAPVDTSSINVDCQHLDWQVSSVAQIFNALSQIFSAVEHLTLAHRVHTPPIEEPNEVDRIQWRKLLRSFSNVKTLHIEDGLVSELSRCLPLEDGEHPLELLPELQKLTYSRAGNPKKGFNSFIDARQNAGRPVTLMETWN